MAQGDNDEVVGFWIYSEDRAGKICYRLDVRCERKRIVKDDSKVFVLRNWKTVLPFIKVWKFG